MATGASISKPCKKYCNSFFESKPPFIQIKNNGFQS